MPTVDPLEAEYGQFRKESSTSDYPVATTVDPIESEYSQFRKSNSTGIQSTVSADPIEAEYAQFKKSDTPETDKINGHSSEWIKTQAEMAKKATDAGLPQITDGRKRLVDAIARSHKAGYSFPSFAGGIDPTGDRTVAIDMENLVKALKLQESNTIDPARKQSVAKERAYWEQELSDPGTMTAAQWTRQTGEPDPVIGMVEGGNIDLSNPRPVKNPDGSVSTVRSMGVNVDGKEVLIPTVALDGSRILSDQEAINQYRTTGKHLGVFTTPEITDRYAQRLHEVQSERLHPSTVLRSFLGMSSANPELVSSEPRIGPDLNDPEAIGPWSTSLTSVGIPRPFPDKGETIAEQTLNAVMNFPVDAANFGLSPAGAITAGALPVLKPALQRLVAAGFTADQIKSAIQAPDWQERLGSLLGAATTAVGVAKAPSELIKDKEATLSRPEEQTQPQGVYGPAEGNPWRDKSFNELTPEQRQVVNEEMEKTGLSPASRGVENLVESGLQEPIGIADAIAEIQRRNAPGEVIQPEKTQSNETAPNETATSGVLEQTGEKTPPAPVTSIKNAQVDIERSIRGLPPAMEEGRRDFGTVWDEASNKIDSDPMLPARLTDELKVNPRAVTDTENAVLLQRQIELQNQFEKAGNDLIIANGTGDISKAGELDAQLSRISDDLLDIYDINKSVGRETGRGLNARKMLANEDFTLARMVTKKRVAKGGAELTPTETSKVREQNQKITDLQIKIDQSELKTHFNELIAASTQEARQAKAAKRGIGEFIEEQANKARERIKARGGRLTAGLDPIDLADHAIIGASYIAKGVTKFADWSGQMVRDLGETVKPFLKDLYEQAKKLHNANARVFTSDERRLGSAKKRAAKRIDELQGKIEAGNFTKPEKPVPITDKELDNLKFRLSRVKEEYLRGVFDDQLKRRSGTQKAVSAVREVLNTSRALKTSLDLSAVLRQGGLIAFGHPIRALKSFPDMLKAFGSEKGAFKAMRDIVERPNAPRYAQSKLYISDPNTTSLSKMEEVYMSRFADKIPLVGASQRAYITFLNKLRADSWDAMATSLAKNGNPTALEANAISNYINVATGRGTLDGLSKAAVGLNTIFFAPRYVASRFEYLAGQPLYKGTARTRSLIAKEYARTLIGLGLVYTLGKMAGAMIETDPRSSDFGKMKFGNTRIDPMAGLSQTSVLESRIAAGATKTSTGKIVPIRGDKVPYGTGNTSDVIARFLRSKLAPIPGAGLDVATGKNVVGQSITPQTVGIGLVTPLALSDIYSAMQDQGIDKGTALGLLSIFGMGLQTYQPKPSKTKVSKKPSLRTSAN